MVKSLLTTASDIQVSGVESDFDVQFKLQKEADGELVYLLRLTSAAPAILRPLKIRWCQPAHNVKGVWSPNSLYEKRLRADWESPQLEARVSVHAPVLCLFGHDDNNVISFACSDVINTIRMEAPVREEDNLIYCQMEFFTEEMPLTTAYEAQIRIDQRAINFGLALGDVEKWWSGMDALKPMAPTPAARMPVYSTWYSYHQNLSTRALLNEAKLSVDMGYETIIVDDGWQTMDTNRGYDYTGDWQPDRLTNMREFVDEVHGLGMKCMIWYSVPFCGKKSNAYQRFKGKFLTENHRWAPVFDPRYPDVREYLINIYAKALKEWNLDGFKLDFIDDFRAYSETDLTMDNGRDYASVNEGVDRLMMDVTTRLQAIRPDIMIEFRQKYIGPAMRKYGNMFRAFDCPNDSATNRLRTTDVKMLCGESIVHADMFTWHYEESVETAALQFANIIFSVPQLSVRLAEVTEKHRQMIRFYTRYWLSRQSVLLDGDFRALAPLANYPVLKAEQGKVAVYGVYEDAVVTLTENCQELDLVNGKVSDHIVFELTSNWGKCRIQVFDCMGNVHQDIERELCLGIDRIIVPPSGIIQITRNSMNTIS